METFFGALGNYKATFGSTLNGKIQRDLFYARARHYNSTLESSLDPSNIPVSVYNSLVSGVNDNLDTFHRYLRLRKRMMGVDQLHYYDLYAPLVENVNLEYPIEQASKNVLAAVAPLGPDYQAAINRALNERWIDLYPNAGKRAGAYSQGGAYDVHPYMLLNFNGKYDDMSTLAHELGHTMQSYLSNKTQPYPTADYPIFVAEVASTFNEALLNDYMLKQIKDDRARLSLLGNYLENIKATVFRQTQFAEFELRATRWRRRASRSPARRSTSSTSTSRASTTATTRACASSTTTSRTSGRSSRTSTGTSTCSSTRRRSRRRRRCRRRFSPATSRPRRST